MDLWNFTIPVAQFVFQRFQNTNETRPTYNDVMIPAPNKANLEILFCIVRWNYFDTMIFCLMQVCQYQFAKYELIKLLSCRTILT